MPFLNLGILAHVDAGKTSLTERILFETGAIDAPGRVDDGTTQTDTLAQERARGITIKAAVVSFDLDDLTVNLIDTPGHADFIAEVQRSLIVLDAVVLLISAVEGIQPQTRKLARAIRLRGIPMMIFINKIDRIGARFEPLLADIQSALDRTIVSMSEPVDIGANEASALAIDPSDENHADALMDILATSSDAFADRWLSADGDLDPQEIEGEFVRQVGTGDIVPVFVGSATRGTGIDLLLDGITSLLPRKNWDSSGDVAATVFKIERTSNGEKQVFARIEHGTLRNRERISIAGIDGNAITDERVKGIDLFREGACLPAQLAQAGEIVRLHGLASARIGDRIGADPGLFVEGVRIAEPKLESIVTPSDSAKRHQLSMALQQLAESDPLITLRLNEMTGDLSVRLFGEIQQQVILETLRTDFGVEALFGEPRPVCIERPLGIGESLEIIGTTDNPFYATVGIRIAPGVIDSGITYFAEPGALPPAYYRVIDDTMRETLTEGLCGWNVTDIVVTLTQVGYWSPVSTGADFRRLTPLVLMTALDRSGTVVCEPIDSFEVVCPADSLADVVHLLITSGGAPDDTNVALDLATVRGTIPTAAVASLERRIYGVGRGTTTLATEFLRYDPVSGPPPERARRTVNPVHRAEYLGAVAAGKAVL